MVAVGMFFLAWYRMCSGNDTAWVSDATSSRRRGLWGYLLTFPGALELVLRGGVRQREKLCVWNAHTLRLNWSLFCLLKELQMEKTLRFLVNSAFSFGRLAIWFLELIRIYSWSGTCIFLFLVTLWRTSWKLSSVLCTFLWVYFEGFFHCTSLFFFFFFFPFFP